jgi:hypothetical protein
MKKYCFLLKSDSVRVINNRIEGILRFIAIDKYRYQEHDIESFFRSIVCVQHKIDTNNDKEVFSFFIGYDHILSLRKNDSITTETNNFCLVKYSEITEIMVKYGYIEIDLNTHIYSGILQFLYPKESVIDFLYNLQNNISPTKTLL